MTAPRLLIVDDSEMNVAIARVVLVAGGFEVDAASSAAEALEKIDAFGPDLLLLDIQMPGMNGLELMQLLKSDPATRHLRIVAFTAFAMSGDEERMRAAGFDGYISKPIDVRTFTAEVRACAAAAPGPVG